VYIFIQAFPAQNTNSLVLIMPLPWSINPIHSLLLSTTESVIHTHTYTHIGTHTDVCIYIHTQTYNLSCTTYVYDRVNVGRNNALLIWREGAALDSILVSGEVADEL